MCTTLQLAGDRSASMLLCLFTHTVYNLFGVFLFNIQCTKGSKLTYFHLSMKNVSEQNLRMRKVGGEGEKDILLVGMLNTNKYTISYVMISMTIKAV